MKLKTQDLLHMIVGLHVSKEPTNKGRKLMRHMQDLEIRIGRRHENSQVRTSSLCSLFIFIAVQFLDCLERPVVFRGDLQYSQLESRF